ncbi:hypothetical protein [Enterococcus italicus]|uniref:hypothetical protein n=1 Tax=Enterococcus italicus TaxID=246144 RepID=UPI003F489EFE
MRLINELTFVKTSTETRYDPELGEWIESEPVKTVTTATITDLGTTRSVEIFGDIKQGAKVIRLMPLFILPDFDWIEFGGKKWELVTDREPDKFRTLIVREVSI